MSNVVVLAKRRAWINLKRRLEMKHIDDAKIYREMYRQECAETARLKSYESAFHREEGRADAMGREVDALREAIKAAQDALEMVRDANRDEPHIPAIALSSVERAITICEGVK